MIPGPPPPRAARASSWQPAALFLLVWLLGLDAALGTLDITLPQPWAGVEVLGWMLAGLVIVLAGLARRLPAQNVVSLTSIILLSATGLEWLNTATGLPFGPCHYSDRWMGRIDEAFAWPAPFFWIVILASSRATARALLEPWQRTTRYGLWIIGLSTLLVVLWDLSWQPFATKVEHYWSWQVPSSYPRWYGTPLANFISKGTATILIFGFATPWLISKRPARSEQDYPAVAAWLAFQIWFAVGNTAHHLWGAAGVGAGTVVLVVAGLLLVQVVPRRAEGE